MQYAHLIDRGCNSAKKIPAQDKSRSNLPINTGQPKILLWICHFLDFDIIFDKIQHHDVWSCRTGCSHLRIQGSLWAVRGGHPRASSRSRHFSVVSTKRNSIDQKVRFQNVEISNAQKKTKIMQRYQPLSQAPVLVSPTPFYLTESRWRVCLTGSQRTIVCRKASIGRYRERQGFVNG